MTQGFYKIVLPAVSKWCNEFIGVDIFSCCTDSRIYTIDCNVSHYIMALQKNLSCIDDRSNRRYDKSELVEMVFYSYPSHV